MIINLIFRSDVSAQTGLGHFSRCLALAERLKSPRVVIWFALQEPAQALTEHLKEIADKVVILPFTQDMAEDCQNLLETIPSNGILFLDGYRFLESYQSQCRNSGHCVFLINEIPQGKVTADYLINHLPNTQKIHYQKAGYTQTLLGPKFALIKLCFLEQIPKPLKQRNHKKLLLNMGGADPQNVTLFILKLLQNLDFFSDIQILIGSAYLHLSSLQIWLDNHWKKPKILQSVSSENLIKLIIDADILLCPPSTIAYEACTIGIPMINVNISDSQSGIDSILAKEGICIPLGNYSSLNSQKLEASIQSAFVNANKIMHSQKKFIKEAWPDSLKPIILNSIRQQNNYEHKH